MAEATAPVLDSTFKTPQIMNGIELLRAFLQDHSIEAFGIVQLSTSMKLDRLLKLADR